MGERARIFRGEEGGMRGSDRERRRGGAGGC